MSRFTWMGPLPCQHTREKPVSGSFMVISLLFWQSVLIRAFLCLLWKLLTSRDKSCWSRLIPDSIQISQSRKICKMCLVAPSLQTFPTSQLQWAGSGRKDLLVKRHHYIWELYIEAFFCMIFQTFDLSLVRTVFWHRPRRVWLRVMSRACSMHIPIITAVARGDFGAGRCKTKGSVWGAL